MNIFAELLFGIPMCNGHVTHGRIGSVLFIPFTRSLQW